MDVFIGLDVSLASTAICVLDEKGKIVTEAQVASAPESLVAFMRELPHEIAAIGLEAGPLSHWLHKGMSDAGFEADLPFPHSLPEFQRLFPDDAACAAYLEKARWGDGFACPHCGTAGEPFHFENRPGVLRCRKCRQNTGLTVGTVMERSHCSTPSAHCSASRATPLLQPMPSFTRESGGTLHVAVMGVNRIGKGCTRG